MTVPVPAAMLGGLILFALVAICSPGANNLLAAMSGAQFGFRRSLSLLGGIAVSVVAVVVLSALGVGALVASAPILGWVLRLAGSLYLGWLAWRIARSPRPGFDGAAQRPPTFRRGVLVTILNPKAWTMSVSAAASFAGLSADPVMLAAIMAGVFAVIVVPNLVLWSRLGQAAGRRLSTDRQWRFLTVALSTLLVVSIVPMWWD